MELHGRCLRSHASSFSQLVKVLFCHIVLVLAMPKQMVLLGEFKLTKEAAKRLFPGMNSRMSDYLGLSWENFSTIVACK